jgi:peptidoglycan/xylan/chitin deacetylase (PgdA/CDA1 family)
MLVSLTVDVEDPDQRGHTDPGSVASIVEAMDATGIRATFFVQGRWAAANPEAAATISSSGHLVGNHSYYHVDTRLLSSPGVRQDVTRGHEQIEASLGVDARPWYRLPYGSGAESPRITRQLRALGYRHVGWDVDVDDYAMTDRGALVPAIDKAITARERAGATHAIVLLHSWPPATVAAMPELCRFVVERCEGAVTVDQVPGNGAVRSISPLVGRARTLGKRTRAAFSHQT